LLEREEPIPAADLDAAIIVYKGSDAVSFFRLYFSQTRSLPMFSQP
jgi:hypothetical protein